MEFRRVERKAATGEWQEIPFSELKQGDCFKLYDPINELPQYEDGTTVHTALSDPIPDPLLPGNFGIECEDAE